TTAFLNTMGQSVPRPGAEPPAPPSPGAGPSTPAPTGAFTVNYNGNSLVFRQGDRDILRHNGSLWRKSVSTAADANVSVVPKDAGFDVVFNFENGRPRAKKLGSVVLEGFTLGQAIRVRDFRAAGAEIAIDDEGAAPMRSGLSYPSEWYSPA